MIATARESFDSVTVPRAGEAVWVERLLWLFMMSFAFDYRASEAREASGGTGIDQLLFLLLFFVSSAGILACGWRYLLVRPGAWLIALWGGFLAYMVANSLLQGVDPGRSIRITLPLLFCLAGMINAHIAGCMGISPSRIVAPVFAAACINILWRIFHGFAFKELDLSTVRTEILSPATNWLAAWIGCAVLLRGRFHWNLPLACCILFAGIFITITRSLAFPILASALATGLCLLLAIHWGGLRWQEIGKRLLPAGVVSMLAAFCLGAAALLFPTLVERWNERLFFNAGARNLGADISYLTRKAEADAIWSILQKDPIHFLHGRGIGASYHWDAAYLPEIYMVFPRDEGDFSDLWFAGHSTWTYSLFSGGVIAVAAVVILLAGIMILSLRAAKANARHPGPDQWLAWLPFVAVCCLLSETLTANPFQERLTGMILGLMAGLPQAFLVRASWAERFPQE